MQCGILDWTLEQEKDISGKPGGTTGLVNSIALMLNSYYS